MPVICCIAYPLGGHGTNTGDDNKRAIYYHPGLHFTVNILCVRIAEHFQAVSGRGCLVRLRMRTGSVHVYMTVKSDVRIFG